MDKEIEHVSQLYMYTAMLRCPYAKKKTNQTNKQTKPENGIVDSA